MDGYFPRGPCLTSACSWCHTTVAAGEYHDRHLHRRCTGLESVICGVEEHWKLLHTRQSNNCRLPPLLLQSIPADIVTRYHYQMTLQASLSAGYSDSQAPLLDVQKDRGISQSTISQLAFTLSSNTSFNQRLNIHLGSCGRSSTRNFNLCA